tara:strand:+ start:1346 stop:1639 length:294 start_codon:yes stop_codon:yes gene_type:complete
MINILQNQIDRGQIDLSSQAFAEFILAIQQDSVDRASLVQSSNMSKFPPTPSLGGTLSTRKGCYEAIYTDSIPEVGQWRRLSDGSIYAVGSAMPSTL